MNSINAAGWAVNTVNTYEDNSREIFQNFLQRFHKKNKQYVFSQINAFDKTIQLKKTLPANLSVNDGYYYLDNDYLGIHSIGESELEAKIDFFEILSIYKEQYVDCNKDDLSQSALELRKKLSKYL